MQPKKKETRRWLLQEAQKYTVEESKRKDEEEAGNKPNGNAGWILGRTETRLGEEEKDTSLGIAGIEVWCTDQLQNEQGDIQHIPREVKSQDLRQKGNFELVRGFAIVGLEEQ